MVTPMGIYVLKRTLKKNVDTEVKGMILKNSPPFPTNSDIKSTEAFPTKIEDLLKYDIVVLGDLSSSQLSINQKRILVDYVQQFGRSVVFLSGVRFPWETKDYLTQNWLIFCPS